MFRNPCALDFHENDIRWSLAPLPIIVHLLRVSLNDSSSGESEERISDFITVEKYNKRRKVEKGGINLGRKKKSVNKHKAIGTSTGRSAVQESSRRGFQRSTKRRSEVSSDILYAVKSLPTSGPFVRTRKSVRVYRISRGSTTSTFSESHGCMRSRLPGTSPVFF